MTDQIENEIRVWANQTKLYQFYNLLRKAHCFTVDDSPLIVAGLGPITSRPNNSVLELKWKRKKIIFTEESLAGAKIIKDGMRLNDSKGTERSLKLFVLNNLLEKGIK